jgi:hypothetical protein
MNLRRGVVLSVYAFQRDWIAFGGALDWLFVGLETIARNAGLGCRYCTTWRARDYSRL